MKEDLHKKIEETMHSLDGLQRAGANPFMYGKIKSRLEGRKTFIPKQLAWRMVISLLIIAATNVVTIVHLNSEKQKTSGAEMVAKEYSISLPQTY